MSYGINIHVFLFTSGHRLNSLHETYKYQQLLIHNIHSLSTHIFYIIRLYIQFNNNTMTVHIYSYKLKLSANINYKMTTPE